MMSLTLSELREPHLLGWNTGPLGLVEALESLRIK